MDLKYRSIGEWAVYPILKSLPITSAYRLTKCVHMVTTLVGQHEMTPTYTKNYENRCKEIDSHWEKTEEAKKWKAQKKDAPSPKEQLKKKSIWLSKKLEKKNHKWTNETGNRLTSSIQALWATGLTLGKNTPRNKDGKPSKHTYSLTHKVKSVDTTKIDFCPEDEKGTKYFKHRFDGQEIILSSTGLIWEERTPKDHHHHNSKMVKMATDGSTFRGNPSAAAVVFLHDDFKTNELYPSAFYYKISDGVSDNYCAELSAINRGLRAVSIHTNLTIYTDSLAAIMIIKTLSWQEHI
jgi:hypothetical protein